MASVFVFSFSGSVMEITIAGIIAMRMDVVRISFFRGAVGSGRRGIWGRGSNDKFDGAFCVLGVLDLERWIFASVIYIDRWVFFIICLVLIFLCIFLCVYV